MQTLALSLRVATHRDIAAVDRLLARSYPKLLKADYPPSVMVTAVPLMARARPHLVTSGKYYVAEAAGHGIVGAGGWSVKSRAGAVAEVRHVASDPRFVRQGIGRSILDKVIREARLARMRRLDCLATRTAVPFYEALGFRKVGPVELGLAAGISFQAVQMVRPL